jgi:hypothetical protein
MIPRRGPIHQVNQAAVFQQMTDPLNDEDATVPTMIVGGVRVSAYLDSDGAFCVSVATDEDTPSPQLLTREDGETIAMRIVVNDTDVFTD